MTLGCGAMAGNSTSDNVGPLHLINIKRIAFKVREPAEAFTSPEGKAYFAGQPMPQPSAQEAAGTSPMISQAVDRFLAKRGIAPPTPAATVAPAGAPSRREVVSGVVDRFLARKGAAGPAASEAPESSCGCSLPASAPSPAPAAPAAAPAPAPAPPPKPETVDFVCEDDVRRARTEGKKIYVDSKTIVTPAASDIDSDSQVLVAVE